MKIYLRVLDGMKTLTVSGAQISDADTGIYVYKDAEMMAPVNLDAEIAGEIQKQKIIGDYKAKIAFGATVKDIDGKDRVIPLTQDDFGLAMCSVMALNHARIGMLEKSEIKDAQVGDAIKVDGRVFICTKAGTRKSDSKAFKDVKDLSCIVDGTSEWALFVQTVYTTSGMADFGFSEVAAAGAAIMLRNSKLAAELKKLLARIDAAAAKEGAKPDDVFAIAWPGAELIKAAQFVEIA